MKWFFKETKICCCGTMESNQFWFYTGFSVAIAWLHLHIGLLARCSISFTNGSALLYLCYHRSQTVTTFTATLMSPQSKKSKSVSISTSSTKRQLRTTKLSAKFQHLSNLKSFSPRNYSWLFSLFLGLFHLAYRS